MPESPPAPATKLSPTQERLLMLTMGGIKFTIMMDFVIIMPLGASLMRSFGVGPSQFGLLLASYGIAAGVSGLLGGLYIDRFERRTTLITLYAGLTVALFACAFAPNYSTLILARIAAGAFGGISTSVILAMIGDAFPPERRGRVLGRVMSAHPIALIVGVPAGLILASWQGWNTPFLLLGGLCLIVLWGAFKTLPKVGNQQSDAHPVRHLWNIIHHRVHFRAFLVRAGLVFSGGCVIPFMAPSLVINLGFNETTQLPLVYLLGGLATFFTIPYIGRLSDRFDKVHVLIGITTVALPAVLVITRLETGPIALTYFFTTMLFVGMSGRFNPTMSLITNSVSAKYRGGFMSLNAAVQNTCGGIANVIGGLLVTIGSDGKMHGYPTAGWVACIAFIATILLAGWLRSAAPHAARNLSSLDEKAPR